MKVCFSLKVSQDLASIDSFSAKSFGRVAHFAANCSFHARNCCDF